MNIVFLDADTVGPGISFERLEKAGNFTKYDFTPKELVIERLANADVAIVNKTRITEEIMRACNRLKLICVAATGMNNIDSDHAAKAGITVKNVAGYSTDSVVQLTYGLLLSLMMRLSCFDRFVKSGDYTRSGFFTCYDHCFSELAGKQIGIVGMGNIGKRSAAVGTAFGAAVVYCSTSGKNTGAPYPRTDLNRLLSDSDVVLVHAPLNDKTLNLINADNLKLMKPTAFIVNSGRGGIVNETDLAVAVDSGIIAGAGLDVYSVEPITSDSPFMNMKHPERMIFSPHIGWTATESRKRLIAGVAENIKSFFNN